MGAQRADHGHPLPRPRYRYVQPPLTPLLVQRPKAHRYPTRFIGAITDAEENDLPLIPLHRLQVLDEERFLPIFAEASFQLGRAVPELFQLVEDAHLVTLAKGDHAEALVPVLAAQAWRGRHEIDWRGTDLAAGWRPSGDGTA